MMIQLLLLLLAPQQQIEQHFQRQQGQIEQIQQQLQQQQLQLGRLLQMLQSSVCSAEIRWVNGSEQKIVPSNSATVVRLNLFSTISKPTDVCLPAEIRVTASYLDASDNLVCSGAKRLVCVNAEGLAEVTSEEMARATSIRVRATALSAGSGVSTPEIELRLQR